MIHDHSHIYTKALSRINFERNAHKSAINPLQFKKSTLQSQWRLAIFNKLPATWKFARHNIRKLSGSRIKLITLEYQAKSVIYQPVSNILGIKEIYRRAI